MGPVSVEHDYSVENNFQIDSETSCGECIDIKLLGIYDPIVQNSLGRDG